MGIKERKRRDKEARKNSILMAAKRVFFEKGFHAATMDKIAEVAELSKGSLYLHFKSKEELYVSILAEGLEILHKNFTEAVEGIKGWEEIIRSIGRAYFRFYQDYQNYFKILFLFQHGEISSNVPEPLLQTCFEKGTLCLMFLSQALQGGIEAGEVEPSDPMELAVILWGSINGLICLYEEEEHRKFVSNCLDDLINRSIDIMIKGLKMR